MLFNDRVFQGEAEVYRKVCVSPRITIAELKNLYPSADIMGMVKKWEKERWVSFSSMGDNPGLLAADRANDVLKELRATIEAKDKEHSISLEWSDGEWLRIEGDSLKGKFAPDPFDKRQREKVDIGFSEIVLVHQTEILRGRIPLFFDSLFFLVAICFSIWMDIKYSLSWWIPCVVYVLAFLIWGVLRFYLCRMSATQIVILCARRMICVPFLHCEEPCSEDVKNFLEAVNARASGEFDEGNADDIDALRIGKNYVCAQCGAVTTKGAASLVFRAALGLGIVGLVAIARNVLMSELNEVSVIRRITDSLGITHASSFCSACSNNPWIIALIVAAVMLSCEWLNASDDDGDCAECDGKKSMVSLGSRAGREALKSVFGRK